MSKIITPLRLSVNWKQTPPTSLLFSQRTPSAADHLATRSLQRLYVKIIRYFLFRNLFRHPLRYVYVFSVARSPTPEKDFVMLMPPQALFASKTNNGFLQLSWRKPKTSYTAKAQSKSVDDGESAPEPYAGSLYSQKIIGFLIEFRWISIDQPKGQESISERIAVRKHRSLTLNGAVQYKMKSSGSENFARQLMNHVTRSKRAVVSLAEKKVWKILTTIPDNVTTVVVSPKKVYRDVLYEFRVLAMSQHDYSMPSNPVRVSTRGSELILEYGNPENR